MREAAWIAGSRSIASLRDRAQSDPASSCVLIARSMHLAVACGNFGVSRMTTMLRTVAGNAFQARTYPATDVAKRLLPLSGMTLEPPLSPATKTVRTSGWTANHAKVCCFHSAHCVRRGSGRSRTAICSGQLVCVIERPCQPLASATCVIAARQCPAWLSPTSATVASAVSAGAPNQQTAGALWCGTATQGLLGSVAASLGVGATPYWRVEQPFCEARAAAPKHVWAAAVDVKAATTAQASATEPRQRETIT